MKVFFDTNVYIAEALLGGASEAMLDAVVRASWRIFASEYLLEEVERVLVAKLGFTSRMAQLTKQRIARRARVVPLAASRHVVSSDPNDSPILAAAHAAGCDYLVTNDRHLLDLHPVESLRIVSLADFYQLLKHEGLLAP